MSDSQGGFYRSGNYGQSRFSTDQGPPYIVKLLHLPVSCDDAFIDDLFSSRYTRKVKAKIVYDPSSNPLETGVVKKSAFVELESFSDQSKVVNWQDLYYKGNRRVVIEYADYNDFQNCMKFNQEHDRELRRIEREFLANKTRGGFDGRRSSHGAHIPGLGILGELEDLRQPARDSLRFGSAGRRTSFGSGPSHARSPPSRFTSMHTATPKEVEPIHTTHATPQLAPPKPKPNPFGNAKPVDIVAKEHELDKKIVVINPTTVKSLGSDSEESLDNKKKDSNGTPSSSTSKASEPPATTGSNALAPAPIPSSIYGQKQSLADILSSKSDPDITGKNSKLKKSASSTPKPQGKPVILKKKPSTVSSPAHQKELERLSSPEAVALETKNEIHSEPNLGSLKIQDGTMKSVEILRSASKPSEEKQDQVSTESSSDRKNYGEKPDSDLSDEKATRTPSKTSGSSRENSKESGERRRRSLRTKRGSVSELTEKREMEEGRRIREQQHLTERNKSFSSQHRPDFKKHLNEITLVSEDKEKLPHSAFRSRGRGRGGHDFGPRGFSSHRRRSSDGGFKGRMPKELSDGVNEPRTEKSEHNGNENKMLDTSTTTETKEVDGEIKKEEDKIARGSSRRGRGRGRGRGYRGRGNRGGRGSSDRVNGVASSEESKPPAAESRPAASA
uniref:RRM domain-containing protein n=1 Tax=Candidozyma auris TaxID=498019 RepID=A0A0L0NS12_CANAR